MFSLTAAILFWGLFTIWVTNTALNVSVKLLLLFMAFWGTFEALEHFGYIVAAPA
jgi:succinate-acetate transporter protein